MDLRRLFFSVLWERMEMYRRVGMKDRAEEDMRYFHECAVESKESDLVSWGSIVLSNIMYLDMGRMAEAEKHLRKAGKTLLKNPSPNLLFLFFNNMANLMSFTGRTRGALYYNKKAIEVCAEKALKKEVPMLYSNRGLTYIHMKKPEKAKEPLKRSILLARKSNDLYTEAFALLHLGIAQLYLGEYENALELLHGSLEINDKIGHRTKSAMCLNAIGFAHRLMKEYQNALPFFDRASRINAEIGDKRSQVTNLTNMGLTYNEMNAWGKAESILKKGLVLSIEIGYHLGEYECSAGLGDAYKALKRIPEALRAYEHTAATAKKMNLHSEYAEVAAHIEQLKNAVRKTREKV